MNRTIKASGLAIVAALCLASCQTEELGLINENEVAASVITQGREVTITADLVDGTADTRTSSELVEGGKTRVYWSPGDQIKVFSAGESSVFTSQNTVPSRTAKFKGTVSMIFGDDGEGEVDYIWGLYPNREDATYSEPDGSSATALITTTLPSVQQGKEDSFADGTFVTIGRSAESLRIPFKGVCTGVYITFAADTQIDTVTLAGLDNEVLAGRFTAGMNEAADGSLTPYVESVVEPAYEVKVVAPDGGTFKKDKMYYIITLPVKFTRGFCLTAHKTTGEVGTCSITPANAPEFKVNAIGSVKMLDNRIDTWEQPSPDTDYVDLGLSVKWAKMNLGASAPEESGDYYAWGEVNPQTNNTYSWSSYRYCVGTMSSLTKYCWDCDYGNYYTIQDRNYVLDPGDDAATVKLEGNWRMPTFNEMKELIDNCTWTWVNEVGKVGYIVSSNVNDNSIFLPAAGRKYSGQTESGTGNYWSSSNSDVDKPYYAAGLFFNPSSHMKLSGLRCNGLSVRPVYCDTDIPVSSISNMEFNQIELTAGHYQTLQAYISPETATNQAVTWSSSDESVATVSSEGRVTAVSEGSATITMTSVDGGKTAQCEVIVSPETTQDYVDLGLSVKWATKNVGASQPGGYGNHFSWGETEPKSNYSWSYYKLSNGSSTTLKKYCNSSRYGYNGFTDNLLNLESDDDAATANLGIGWRIPSSAEWKELTDNCTWRWISRNGTRGLRIVSNINGNSIFLPACGYYPDNRQLYSGRMCFYWLSSAYSSNPSQALCRILDASAATNVNDSYWSRCFGMSVRPVYDESALIIHPESVSIDRPVLSLTSGSTAHLSATVLPENAADKTVVWSSSDTSVATVDSQGNVTAVGIGTATITVTTEDGGMTANCIVDVYDPVRDDFNPNTYLLYRANTTENTSGGNYYSTDSYMPGLTGSVVEMKFQLTGPNMITSSNMSSHDGTYDYIAITNTQFVWNETYRDDGDWYDDEWTCRISSPTELLYIKFDGVNNYININGTVTSCDRSTMSLSRLFATYDHESDEGIYEVYSGIPDGSKLYYVKAWDANGTLNNIGYATTALNPDTNRTEYCWCNYYPKTGNVTYTFANDASHQGGFEGYTYN